MFIKIKKIIFSVFGITFLILGVLGYILPGLPGTIFLIISASFFVRSSTKMYNYVVNNRYFGNIVRTYFETKAMPVKAKFFALGSIILFSCISLIWAPYNWVFDIIIICFAVIGVFYILRVKTLK
tara:strand:+ start:17 stop:391 length:375 start_codon:yes stop_codon:yes gene_type:complete